MGIEFRVANVIVREHAYRPITGDVYLMGRQTMYFSPLVAKDMVLDAGLILPVVDFQPESRTRLAKDEYISDDDFFRLLRIPKIKAIDISDYEGADIVHDLTKPIPDSLEGVADFILDGSTLDNVFDPATMLRNIARLLKPGGRFVSVNVASNVYNPYFMPTAHVMLDYFIENGFSDVKVYIFVYKDSIMNAFTPDLSILRRDMPHPQNFLSPYDMSVVCFAEKGQNSTWDRSPVQHQYRDDWSAFERNLAEIMASKRPHLARSTGNLFTPPGEFLWVDHMGTAHKNAVPPPPTPAQEKASMSIFGGKQLAGELGRRVANRLRVL